MNHECPVLIRLMALCVTVAKRAGSIIRDVRTRGNLRIVDKGVNDYQTEADRLSEQCIIGSIRNAFPKVTVIGEEGMPLNNVQDNFLVKTFDDEILRIECPPQFRTVTEADLVVWVDPLDGTFDFTRGELDHVTVLIGIAYNSEPIAGIINQPFFKHGKATVTGDDGRPVFDRTIWGLVGVGTGGDVKVGRAPANELIIVTTSSHYNRKTKKTFDILKPSRIIKVGGAGYKVLVVLEGEAHAYLYVCSGTKRWDTCAPEAVLRAAGGRCTDIRGNRYDYGAHVNPLNENGVLATAAGFDHDTFVRRLPINLE